MAHRTRYRRRNPRSVPYGKIAVVGLGALALTSTGVRDQIGATFGAFFGQLGSSAHGVAGQAGGSVAQAAGISSALSRMIGANPNFVSQAKTWRGLRAQRGEDPNDWTAFRTYEKQIGAPDPGANAPQEWPGSF